MATKTEGMMQLDAHDAAGNDITIRNPIDIAHRAHEYYDHLFTPGRRAQADIDKERSVSDLLQEERQQWYYDGVCITAEDVWNAAENCPNNEA